MMYCETTAHTQYCNYCSGPVYQLGKLGRVQHTKCRNCGAYEHHDSDIGESSDDETPVVQAEGI